jgi:hypothetical protein
VVLDLLDQLDWQVDVELLDLPADQPEVAGTETSIRPDSRLAGVLKGAGAVGGQRHNLDWTQSLLDSILALDD